MARLTTVKAAKASKRRRVCVLCGHEVQIGETYRYIEKRMGRSGHKVNFCHACQPRPSHYASGKTADVLVIGEDFDAAIAQTTAPEDIATALETAKSAAEAVAEEYEEAAQNQEDGFGHPTTASEENREKSENLMEWVSTLENALEEIQNVLDERSGADEEEEEEETDEEPETEEDFYERILDLANTAIQECPV